MYTPPSLAVARDNDRADKLRAADLAHQPVRTTRERP